VRRVLALVLAVGMVVGAVYLRRSLRDDNSGRSDDGDSGSTSLVYCSTELREVCEAATLDGQPLEGRSVEIEDPGTTAARLSAQSSVRDVGWLVPSVWTAVVAANRQAAGLSVLPTESKPLAEARLVAVARPDQARVLTAKCGKEWATSCVADAAGQQWSSIGGQPAWGPVKIGLGPRTTTGWLLAVTSAVTGRTGRADFATNDLDADDGFQSWFEQLTAVRPQRDPVGVLLTAPGTYGVAYDLRTAESIGLASQRGVTLTAPQPPQTAQVVLVGGRDIDVAPLSEILQQQGWSAPAAAAQPPNGGVLQHLIDTK